ncbi:MAG: GrpB family protein [Clostridiales bacterium]|jgi:hypothetical protein|nr:GrpB family protein [Clostridiales bacterium]
MGKELSEMTIKELWELFPIILKEHNSEYKSWYIEQKENIIEAIGQDNFERISHIGSSAVEGLISKQKKTLGEYIMHTKGEEHGYLDGTFAYSGQIN